MTSGEHGHDYSCGFAFLDSGMTWLGFVAVCLGLIPHALIIAGGPAALVATWLIHQAGTGYAVSVYIVISAVITLIAPRVLKSRSPSDIPDE